jgi:uncharacterized membrane protein YdjX (TVP38/TMEM64 family)
MHLTEYAAFVGVVFAVNLMPAFGPPTWLLIVFFSVKYNLSIVPLVLLGATAATCGRYLLALGSRRWRGHMSASRLDDLEALRSQLEASKTASYGGLALFLLSPLPSAQLFEAAGVTGVPLRPLAAAFFCGRIISYSIYATAASLAAKNFQQVLRNGLTSPWSIALQLLLLAGVVGLAFIPWRRVLARFTKTDEEDSD